MSAGLVNIVYVSKFMEIKKYIFVSKLHAKRKVNGRFSAKYFSEICCTLRLKEIIVFYLI